MYNIRIYIYIFIVGSLPTHNCHNLALSVTLVLQSGCVAAGGSFNCQLARGWNLPLPLATCHCHLLSDKQLPGPANWPHPLANASALAWTLASVQLTPIDNGSFNSSFNGSFNVANWSIFLSLSLSLLLYLSLMARCLLILWLGCDRRLIRPLDVPKLWTQAT